MMAPSTVVFACEQGAGRSQIAAAFFNYMANPNFAVAVSAATRPAECVQPEVVEAMREFGIDLSREIPRAWTDDLCAGAALVVAMGCGERPRAAKLEEWSFADPHGLPLEEVRAIRDAIRRRVWKLLAREGWWRLRLATVRPLRRNRAAGM